MVAEQKGRDGTVIYSLPRTIQISEVSLALAAGVIDDCAKSFSPHRQLLEIGSGHQHDIHQALAL